MPSIPTHYHPVTGLLYWNEQGHWFFQAKRRVMPSGMKTGFIPLAQEGLVVTHAKEKERLINLVKELRGVLNMREDFQDMWMEDNLLRVDTEIWELCKCTA